MATTTRADAMLTLRPYCGQAVTYRLASDFAGHARGVSEPMIGSYSDILLGLAAALKRGHIRGAAAMIDLPGETIEATPSMIADLAVDALRF